MPEPNTGQLNLIDILTVGEAAGILTQQLGVPVNAIWLTHLYYRGRLRGDLCPIIRGRRLIPRSYLPEIVQALQRWEYIPATPVASDPVQPVGGAT